MELSQTGDSGERPWVREPWSSSSGLDVKEQGTGESDCLLLKTGSILREVTTYSCAGCALHKAPSEGEIRSGICLRGQVIHRWMTLFRGRGTFPLHKHCFLAKPSPHLEGALISNSQKGPRSSLQAHSIH